MKIFIFHAFAKVATGGNPAGVALLDKFPSEEEMQEIAKKVNLSETAFVVPQANDQYEVRFFTPTQEVPQCGHATLASFGALQKENNLLPGGYIMNCRAGQQHVEIHQDGSIFTEMNFADPVKEVSNEEVLSFTDVEPDDLWADFPAQVVSGGIPILLYGIISAGTLVSLTPDMEKIQTLCEEHGAQIVYLVSKQTSFDQSTASTRMFAPPLGIREEAATGMAAGALGSLLWRNELTEDNHLIIEQGYSMGRPSELLVHKRNDSGEDELYVGGKVQFIKEIEV